MHWQDKAIILGSKRWGEKDCILEVMSVLHGRYVAMVRNGRTRAMQTLLQAGNLVSLEWNARLAEHLGSFRVELLKGSAATLMSDALSLYAFQLVSTHLRLLPERVEHKELYERLELIIFHCDKPLILMELIIRFELALLKELGFGLDLSACVVTGSCTNLLYVSPKSGCAVSGEAGEAWKDKLLILPPFLLSPHNRIKNHEHIVQGVRLTGYFLERYVWRPRAMEIPSIRDSFWQKYFKQDFFSKHMVG